MAMEKITYVLVSVFGLYCAIRFKHLGKTAIEQRKKLNKIFPRPLRQSEEDFDAFAIIITQIMFLLIGTLPFLVGLAKLFSS
jgi:hypothetical protein